MQSLATGLVAAVLSVVIVVVAWALLVPAGDWIARARRRASHRDAD